MSAGVVHCPCDHLFVLVVLLVLECESCICNDSLRLMMKCPMKKCPMKKVGTGAP